VTYDSVGNKATLTFEGLPGQRLADGNYRLTVRANDVSDSDGAKMTDDFRFEFHTLAGDANGDRVTNDIDLYQVWRNLLRAPADRDLGDDLNGDGQVNDSDVAVVLGNYLATLPPPLAPAPLMSPPPDIVPEEPAPLANVAGEPGLAEKRKGAGQDRARFFKDSGARPKKLLLLEGGIGDIAGKLEFIIEAGEENK
jgi:hypothetical protein